MTILVQKIINHNKTDFLTVAEIANLLRLSELTIYKYIKEGKISAFEFGGHYRITKSSLDNFINNHKFEISKGVNTNE